MPGVIRTRVGYAGGTTESPTYQRIGDHTETLQVDFDSDEISYEALADVFWNSHDPREKSWSKQYMSIAFFHSEEQERVLSEKKKGNILTEIMPFERFYLAEDYHQKYYLQQNREVMHELQKFYPDFKDFIDSTLAARLNGYAAGYGSLSVMEKELNSLGLWPEEQKRLGQILGQM